MDDGEDHEDSLDNCIPLKKRRLENQSSCENDEKHQLVSEFLFRSAATPSEIAQISDKVKSRIESIYKIISEGGYDAYNTLRSSINKDRCNADSCAPPKHYEDDPKSLEDSIIRGDPRQYQIALFETSKNRNTIVNLETGKGKTLVALLLIRYLSPLFQEGKQTLFLVPSVALAMQHSSTLRANLPYTVATASHNSTRNPGAREAMAAANILVATHGAMLDLFMHYGDLFQMQRINLLVVDECHYARGEHGYAQIMRNFYHPLDSHTRPRVLGLVSL
jgi:endoribonuclease Dicer